jgi:enolase
MKIECLRSREVLDSRGNLTLEVETHLTDGHWGSFIVPAGASKGEFEAVALHDDNPQKTLKGAVANVEELSLKVTGKEFASQSEIDHWLLEADGTDNKSKLGANVILGISVSYAQAMAVSMGLPLFQYVSNVTGFVSSVPCPFINVINGGAHANNDLAFQEFMLVPLSPPFDQAIMMVREVFLELKSILKQAGHSVAVGDEGGFAPKLASEMAALDLLVEACTRAGYTPGQEIAFALDVAANDFYCGEGQYNLNGAALSSAALVDHYAALAGKYPIISIEDPLAERDLVGWRLVTEKLGGDLQIVGDDLFVTNKAMLQRGIEQKLANAVLIKPNQVGTLTETFETVKLALDNGYHCMVSHRSGDSEDVAIAHIAVGLGVGQFKSGSVCRSERTAKYNELLRISEVVF